MKKCAYCGNSGPFTLEHVWPKCFLERTKGNYANYSVKSKTVHGAEYTIKDVCTKCNNKKLSPLDAYFCSLYDRFFVTPVKDNESVEFVYDYDLLSRVLLKIAYNTSRIGTSDSSVFATFVSYILGEDPRPDSFYVITKVVSPTDIIHINNNGIDHKVVEPIMYRSAVAQLNIPERQNVVLRFIAINSFYFYIVIKKKDLPIYEFAKIVHEFPGKVPGSVVLNPMEKFVILESSAHIELQSYYSQIHTNAEQYHKFFSKKKES